MNVDKCVFRTKHNANGIVHKLKSMLVAKGFQQNLGILYSDTFSPRVKSTTIRIIITLVVSFGWVIHQVDIINTFLNGNLQEKAYMTQPGGFKHPKKVSHVCKLTKTLHGLKHTPRV